MTERLLATLAQKQITPTPMRLLVLEQFLSGSTGARGLSDLEQALPRADRITLYRTLRTFVERGLLHGVTDGSGATRYALCDEACSPAGHADVHPHFRCRRCGETVCLTSISVSAPTLPDGFVLEQAEFLLTGVCEGCHA